MVSVLEVLENDPINGRDTGGTNFIVVAVVARTNGSLTVTAARAEETNRREVVGRLRNETRIEGRNEMWAIWNGGCQLQRWVCL